MRQMMDASYINADCISFFFFKIYIMRLFIHSTIVCCCLMPHNIFSTWFKLNNSPFILAMSRFTVRFIQQHTYTHTHFYIFICIYICINRLCIIFFISFCFFFLFRFLCVLRPMAKILHSIFIVNFSH